MRVVDIRRLLMECVKHLANLSAYLPEAPCEDSAALLSKPSVGVVPLSTGFIWLLTTPFHARTRVPCPLPPVRNVLQTTYS